MLCRLHTLLPTMLFLFVLLISSPFSSMAALTTPPAKKVVQEGGVGLQVVPVASGEIVVIAVLAKSPAAKAKLSPGDLIIAVDGTPLRGSNFADVTRAKLWGKVGSKVKITWLRPGVAGKKNAQLLRIALKDDPSSDLAVKMLVPGEKLPVEAVKP